MIKQKKKIVILGGGFGGLYAYKGLYKYFKKNDIDITIVNRNNYFIFTPLLHEVATGGIAHHQVVESIRQVIYKTDDKLHVAEVESIDTERHVVKTSVAEIPYDVLIVALGATTNFFNAPGADKNAMVLKDLRDAIRLRTTFIEAFEKASEMKDTEARKKELTFAVIGGGPTGVELISEMAELFSDTFLKYYHGLISCEDITLCLINRDKEVLGPFDPVLRKSALKALHNSGVKVMLNTGVKEVHKDSITLTDDSVLKAKHIIWTAGVKPNTPKFSHNVTLDNWGRVSVNKSLQMNDCPNVFVLGDVASLLDESGRPLPMLAQVAVKQGLLTGLNIKKYLSGKKLVPFVYKSEGQLASVGQWKAVANIRGYKFTGPIAWFMWRTIYLFKFLSGSKKVKIVVDWTMNIFYPRDITKA